MTTKRILLTGARGYIGRHCIPFLIEKEYEIHAVSSTAEQREIPDVYWHQADLLEQKSIKSLLKSVKPTHLLHLAWNYCIPGKVWNSTDNFSWIQASLELVQNFYEYGGVRAVIAGTCAEYDWRYGYCSEKLTPLNPATQYGASKHALQTIFNSYVNHNGLSGAWGRIFFIYGPHEYPEKLVASVIRSFLLNKPVICTHGNQIRDFLYVEDVADALVSLVESDVQGSINIASGNPIILRDIIFMISDQIGKRSLLRIGELPERKNEPPLILGDTQRLSYELHWKPSYDLNKGIERTVEWWKKQLKKVGNIDD